MIDIGIPSDEDNIELADTELLPFLSGHGKKRGLPGHKERIRSRVMYRASQPGRATGEVPDYFRKTALEFHPVSHLSQGLQTFFLVRDRWLGVIFFLIHCSASLPRFGRCICVF